MKNIVGVTFNFDESILLDPKIQIPLNFYKTNHNFTIQFKQQLYANTTTNTHTNTTDYKISTTDYKISTTDKNKDIKGIGYLDNRIGYLDIKELEELINENYLSTKNLYNSFISNTINEHKLQQLENEKLQQQQLQLENERLQQQQLQLENEKLQQQQLQLENERLQQQQLQLENEKLDKERLERLDKERLERLDKERLDRLDRLENKNDGMMDYIPKNKTVIIFDEMKEEFMKLEEIYNETRQNIELKSIRIELSKKIKICLNSIANTQKQVDLTFKTLSRILNESRENLKIFILFKIVEGVLNCCEQGQIYINPKSVWSFSRLLASIDNLNSNFNIIFITLLTFKTILIIPKFYFINSNSNSNPNPNSMNLMNSNSINSNPNPNPNSMNSMNLMNSNSNSMNSNLMNFKRLYEVYEYPEDMNEEIIYNKRLSSYIRLYLSYLCIKNDFNTIWSYYANVINSSWNNIFIQFIPCILITILNITSYFMYHIYKLQFKKVLRNINKLLENKLIKYNNTSSNQMYIGQLLQFYQDFKCVTVTGSQQPTPLLVISLLVLNSLVIYSSYIPLILSYS